MYENQSRTSRDHNNLAVSASKAEANKRIEADVFSALARGGNGASCRLAFAFHGGISTGSALYSWQRDVTACVYVPRP